jgi:integrase
MGAADKYAVRAGLASKNVLADIDRRHDVPTEHAREIKYLTHAQLQGPAERTERFETLTLTLILGYCGIRFGEAAALRRGSVKDGKLTIRESATRVTGQGMVTTRTKTGQGT